MKIAILSDMHFGYAYSTELENDSFDAAEEAMEKALNSDLIILAGDIFDSRLPKTGVWAKSIKILVKPLMRKNSSIKLVQSSKNLKEISERTLSGIPVVAIHGNHERRSKAEINTVEALENAGILIHLHANSIVFEKDGRKVAIHGIGNVPERFAKSVLDQWNPKPIEGCYNILLLHQSIDPYIFSPLEPPTLTLSNLPKGFDLIVNGHLHTRIEDRIGSAPLIIPGSLTVTQLEKTEAEIEKGFYDIEVDSKTKINFVPLEKNRKFFYEEIKLDKNLPAREQIENLINKILSKRYSKQPLIKLKIFGKEEEVLDQELRDIEKKYSDNAIISFSKELESPEITKKIEFLRNLREQRLSIEEIGLRALKKNLDELDFSSAFDYEQTFNLLSENELERALNILLGEQKTLTQVLRKS